MTITNTRPAELQNLINARVNAFNTHADALFRSYDTTKDHT